jgi:hypothetical protein
MRTALAAAALGGVVLTGSAMLAAPGQQPPAGDRPGQISQAKVWVENRGRNEAVPVVIQDVTTSAPIGVQVIGTPTVTIAPSNVVLARLVRQQWEYRTITLPSGADAAAVLSTAGADGWETTGIVLSNQPGSPVVLRRPR